MKAATKRTVAEGKNRGDDGAAPQLEKQQNHSDSNNSCRFFGRLG